MKEVTFAPGSFDGLTEDEAKELYATIMKMVEDGSLFENSEELDMDILQEEEPELYARLMGRQDLSQ